MWSGFYILCAIIVQCVANPIVGGESYGKIVMFDNKRLIINEKHYPFMVYLRWMENVSKKEEGTEVDGCGGTLIGMQTVLTAAHCIPNPKSKQKIEVVAGIIHLSYEIKNAQRRFVEKYVVHQKYEEPCDNNKKRKNYCLNDIALVWVGKPFKLTSTVKPAILASDKSVVQNKVGVILGWGYTEEGHYPHMLHRAMQKVIPLSECKKEYTDTKIDSGKLCLISPTKTSVFCNGDSGGPFTYKGVVYGVGSFGRRKAKEDLTKNCNPKYPSVYMNVAHYENWIKTTIKNWSPKELKQFVRFEDKRTTGDFFNNIKPTLPPDSDEDEVPNIGRPQNQRRDPPNRQNTKPNNQHPGNASKGPNIQQPKGKKIN